MPKVSARRSVLLIEDDGDYRDLVREMLRRAVPSWHVESAGSLAEGLIRVAAGGLDVLLLDVNLPDSAGLGSAQAILQAAPAIPVVILSSTDEQDLPEVVHAGVQDYLQKDRLIPESLVSALVHAIDRKAVEHALKESEARYRLLFEGMPQPAWLYDPRSLRILTVNQAAIELYGFSAVEFREMTLADLRSTEGVPAFESESDARTGGSRASALHQTKDGSLLWVEMATHPVSLNGEDRRLAVITDMGERQRSEAALRASEERFRALVEHSASAVVLLDERGRVTYQSQSALRILGQTFQDRLGQPAADLVHPDDLALTRQVLGRCLEHPGERVTAEVRVRHASGQWLVVDCVAVNRLSEPAIRAIVVNYTDVTARHGAEAALRASEERLRLATLATNDVIWDWNLVAEDVWWSEGLFRVFGIPLPTSGTAPIASWTERIHPEDRERVLATIHEVISSGSRSWEGEYRFERADGTYAHCLDRGHVVADQEGRPVRMIGAMIDITERKALAEQLRQSQKMEAIGRLAGGIAHDFNNLLTAILGYSDLGQRKGADAAGAARCFTEIRRSGELAAALTHQLLAFSRKQVIKPEVLHVGTVVQSLGNMLRRLLGEDLQLSIRVSDGAGSVEADKGQIEQILMNLAVNARDALPRGGQVEIEVRNLDADEAYVRTQPEVAPGPYVELAVSDTGTGIAAAVLPHIFEPFYTTKEQGVGTGLGLAVVYGIVRQSGGHIQVESAPGRGSRFGILLPRVPESRSAKEPPRLSEPLAAGAETLLVVEDEPAVRALVREILETSGYRVLEAASGEEALSSVLPAHTGPLHLLLTDVVMAGMNGRELAERLRMLRPEASVLYMSGYANDATLRDGVLTRAHAFLHKPFTAGALARKVREVLDGAVKGVKER